MNYPAFEANTSSNKTTMEIADLPPNLQEKLAIVIKETLERLLNPDKTARTSPQSIAGWRDFGVSFPLQFFRTNPYDVISGSCRRPAATAINFHPATGQTTS